MLPLIEVLQQPLLYFKRQNRLLGQFDRHEQQTAGCELTGIGQHALLVIRRITAVDLIVVDREKNFCLSLIDVVERGFERSDGFLLSRGCIPKGCN